MHIILAAKCNNVKVLQKLLDNPGHLPIDAPDVDGWNSLAWAADKGHLEVVRLLLDYGADINWVDNDGNTALFWAVNNGHVDVVQKMLEHENLDIMHRNVDGEHVYDVGGAAMKKARGKGRKRIFGEILKEIKECEKKMLFLLHDDDSSSCELC